MSIFRKRNVNKITYVETIRTGDGEKIDDRPIGNDIKSEFVNGYCLNPYVYRCIELIADSCSSINPIATNNKDEALPKEHWVNKLIKRPNPNMSFRDLMYFTAASFKLNGNAFILPIISDTYKEIIELWPISPMNVKAERLSGNLDIFNPVDFWVITNNGKETRLKPNELIHIHTYNPIDPMIGISPLFSAKTSVEQQTLTKVRNHSILRREARPKMVYEVPENSKLTEVEYDNINHTMKKLTGPSNSGKYVILDNGNKLTEMGLSTSDIDFLNGLKISMREIVTVMGVPPEKVGDGENKTYANATEANKEFAQDTILPILKKLYGEIEMYIYNFDENIKFTFDPEDLKDLKGDEKTKFQSITNANFLTIDEKRSALGYEPLSGSEAEWGDQIVIAGGNVLLRDLVNGTTTQQNNLNSGEEKA